jgi:hypothetical protein
VLPVISTEGRNLTDVMVQDSSHSFGMTLCVVLLHVVHPEQ